MTSVAFDTKELSRQCGEEVPEIYVVVAKHEVLDFDSKTIAELLGVTQAEIQELQQEETYQKVLLLLRSSASQARVDAELGYDRLEQLAVNRLLQRVELERDGDFLLKVAAMANKATRRTKDKMPLDPSQAGIRVPLTLTQRFVKHVNNDGSHTETEERSVSLSDGRHVNPSFDDVNQLLNVTATPFMDTKMKIETHMAKEPTADDLMDSWEGH